MNDANGVSRRMESSLYYSQPSKIHKRRSNCETVGKKIFSGRNSSGYVDENGKLLLEVQVTESLCADMSTTAAHDDKIIEEKGHVEVTIVRPLPAAEIFAKSINNKNDARPAMDILERVDEKNSGVRMLKKSNNKNTCTSKLIAAPVNHFFNYQKCGSKTKLDPTAASNCAITNLKDIEGDRDSNIPNFCSVEAQNDSNGDPLIELGALHKVLDRLRPDDLESTSAWYSSEPCCREILQRFQNLLREWVSDRKKLDQCLAMDLGLTKCENCGVIRRSAVPQIVEKIIDKKDCEKVAVEREVDSKLINSVKNNLKMNKMETVRNWHPVDSSIASEIAKREKNVSKIHRIPVAKKISVKGTVNDRRTIDLATHKNTIKNTIKKNEPDNAAAFKNAHDSILRSQMTDEKRIDITGVEKNLALMETVEYLARGNFDLMKDEKSQDFSNKATKLLKDPFFREAKIDRKNSFNLYGSRDVDFHRNSNFFSNDRSGLNPEHENGTKSRSKRKEATVVLGSLDASQRSVNYSHDICDENLKLHGSDTSSFSSSSAENLIRQWMTTGCNVGPEVTLKNNVKNNVPCRIRAEPSVNNVNDIRAQIAEAIQKFANRSTLSEDNLYSQPEFGDKNSSGSSNEVLNIGSTQQPDNNRCLENNNYSRIRNCAKGEQASNTTWGEYTEDYVPIGVSNSTQVLSKMTEKKSMSALTVMSSRSFNYQDLSIENSERFQRQILYDQASSCDSVSRDSLTTAAAASKALLIYRKILESNEEMDWECFEQLVTALHPSQRELWSDICKAVSNEAKRVADETGAMTEVCIEINPQACRDKKGTVRSRDDEITFELDMTLQDFRAIFEMSDRPVTSKETKERK